MATPFHLPPEWCILGVHSEVGGYVVVPRALTVGPILRNPAIPRADRLDGSCPMSGGPLGTVVQRCRIQEIRDYSGQPTLPPRGGIMVLSI